MIECPNCGRENEDEYKYCLGCGSVLPRPKPEPAVSSGPELVDCPHCSEQVPSTFKFCGACGGQIKAPPRAAETSQQASASSGPSGQPSSQASSPSAPAPTPEARRDMKTEISLHTPAEVGRLVVIKPDGSEGAKIPLVEGEVELGRDSEHEVLSADPFLAPHHASVIYRDGGFVLRDLGSTNGTFVRIASEIELNDGDHIRLGQELLVFRSFGAIEPMRPKQADDKTLAGGSPDHGIWGRLALVHGPDLETRAFVFSDDEITIGRETGQILFRDDGFVSGRHARISKVEGKAFLKDLGSSNGTYIRIRGDRPLEPGDLVLMGQQLFRLEA